MSLGAEIAGLAVCFPKTVRRNDWWQRHHPEVLAAAAQRGGVKVWSAAAAAAAGPFLETMRPYLDDPFRGTCERRVLGPEEPMLGCEVTAARRALQAAQLTPDDVDLCLSAAFLGDAVGLGSAVFVARALGLTAAAWNVETACAGSLAALQLAAAMVHGGQARRVLVTTSCSYSRLAEPTDTLSFTCGDGAAALVVGPPAGGGALLGSHAVPTVSTCEALFYELCVRPDGAPGIRMRSGPTAGRVIREVSEACVLACCRAAAARAGVALEAIDHFVFNTPTAWYHKFCCQALGIDPARSVDTYPRFANVGPVLMPANLHAMAAAGRLRPGALVLLYSIGTVSSAGATVLRWGAAGVAPAVD